MTQEEKAKLYDELKVKAQELAEDGYIDKLALVDMFPELKKSRDEMIRQLLISFVKYDMPDNYSDDFSKEDCLAWLEKQGEQNPADTEKGTNGSEREFPIPEPPLTIKHAKEVMGIKQDDAWSEEDEKCLENAIMYCEWARDIAPNLHCYEISEKSINWLKSLKGRAKPQST